MHADNFLTTSDPRHCCPRCDIPAVDRLNYFTGQFLAERDFRAEQDYHVGKHRNHNRYLHGWGAVCGLKVVPHPNDNCPDRVVIEPGLAVDCCGREIVVPEAVCVDLAKALAPSTPPPQPSPRAAAAPALVLVSLCYRECCGERVPALYSECGCGEDGGLHASRVHESYEVEVERLDPSRPPPWLKNPPPGSMSMKWASTIGVARATRAALSPDGARLYVVTDAEAGVLHVFDTATGFQVAAKPLTLTPSKPARAVGVAASPDGAAVYVLCRPENANPATKVEHSILIVDAADLTKPATRTAVGKAKPSAADAIACGSSGEVFVLIPGGAPGEQFYRAAAGGATPPTPVPTPLPVSAMAMAPAGTRVFLGADAANTVVTYNRATAALATSPVAVAPRVLAVTDDEKSLLVTDGAAPAVLHAHEITPGGLAPASTTAPLGATESVAAMTAVNGWAYASTRDAASGSGAAGTLSAVSLTRLAAGATDSVVATLPVVAGPAHVLAAPAGTRVYVVGSGDPAAPAPVNGGVSVVDLVGGDCAEILWRQLEGCPECKTECVPLALVVRWTPGRPVTAPQIDNRIRPLLPSTNTLRDLILCCCGGHAPPGPRPEPPATDPTPPPALKLTRLVALSWAHNTADNPLLDVKDLPAAMRERGLTAGIVIGFDDVILARYPLGSMLGDVDPEHVFQVHLRHPELEKRFPFPTAGGTAPKFPLVMRFPIATGPAAVVPVTWVPDTPDGMRVADAIYADPAGSTATGLAYLFNRELRAVLRGVELWARVNGDFISDLGKRPVDVDFVRFALRKTDDALQPVRGGGVFESWFGCRPQ